MASITIDFADGSSHTYENVPSTATPEQVQARAEKDFAGKGIKHIARKPGAQPEAPKAPKQEPGWFESGSKSEAAVRGFSQGATLGFGDEISALVRRFAPEAIGGAPAGQTYEQLRDTERASNQDAASKNTGSYIAGSLIGGVPAVAATGGAGALRSGAQMGALGAAQGLGAGEGSAVDQLKSAGTGALIGAAVGSAGAKINELGKGASAAGSAMKPQPAPVLGQGKASEVLGKFRADKAAFEKPINLGRTGEFIAGAGLGGSLAAATGNDPLTGAAIGALGIGGRGGAIRSTLNQPVAKSVIRGAGSAALRTTGALAQAASGPIAQTAYSQALQQMSGQQARSIVAQKDAQIQQEVASGRPEYAAKFSALQDPAYRVAENRSTGTQDDDEDDDEFESED